MESSPSRFADFMRSNDPGIGRGISKASSRDTGGDDHSDQDVDGSLIGSSENQKRHSEKPLSKAAVAATAGSVVSSHDSNSHIDYFRQNAPAAAAAMFASESTTSSTSDSHEHSSRPNRHNQLHNHHQNHHSHKKRYPPSQFDTRPNLKNDLSDSYQQDNDDDETSNNQRQQQHERFSHYTRDKNNVTNSMYAAVPASNLNSFHHREPTRTNSQNNNNSNKNLPDEQKPSLVVDTRNKISTSNRSLNSSGRNLSDPRPLPRPGKPPPCNAKAIGSSKLLGPQLGRRCLSLLSTKASSDDSGEQASIVLKRWIKIECIGCKTLLEGIPNDAIAVECPHCGDFYPTVDCRVMMMQ